MRRARLVLPALLVAGFAVAAPAAATPAPPSTPGAAPVSATAVADTVTVTGVVRDDDGRPVPAAVVKGWRYPTDAQTTTADDGSYRLVVSRSENQVCADGSTAGGSPYGYSTRCVSIPSAPAGATVNVPISLFVQGLVTGRVVDAAGAPLHDVALRVNNVDTAFVSGADGTYAIRGAVPGDDSVCGVGAGDHGGGSATGYLDGCTEVTVRARASVTAPDLVLDQPGGAITGTVRDGRRGAGLAGVHVWAADTQGGNNQVETTTRADGTYSLLGLVTQTFEVCFDGTDATGGAGTGGYGNQCWKYQDQPDGFGSNPSTPVPVHVGGTVTGIDGALPRWGAIAGRITDPGGRPVAGVRVSVGRLFDFGRTVTTGADGRYRAASLVPGDYAVCVQPGDTTAGGTGYLDYCVGADAPGTYPSTVAATVVGNATQTVDDTLVPAGRLSGVVVDSAGRGVRGAVVSVSEHGGNSLGSVTADAQGRWAAVTGSSGDRRIVPGDYDVIVSGPPGSDYVAVSHPSSYIVDSQGFGTATPVTVVGGRLSRITDTLYHGGTMQGTVHDQAGVGQYALVTMALGDADPTEGPYVYTARNGTWTLSGLPPGTYSLCVSAYGRSTAAPASFLARCPVGPTADGVTTTVTLAEGRSVAVDTSLTAAGGVAGRVTNSAGRPLYWSTVTVRQADTLVAQEITDLNGAFRVDRLKPGSYTVCAVGGRDQSVAWTPDQAWASRCWGATVGAPGAFVAVASGSVRTGLAVVLPPGAWVGGRVSTAAGPGVDAATVVLASGSKRFPAVTQNGSWYTQVPPGRYTVCASAPGLGTSCYRAPGAANPTPVVIETSGSTWDLDIVLG